MPIEILKHPEVVVMDGTTYHVCAVERPVLPPDGQPGEEQVRHVGFVAIKPSSMARYLDDDNSPYMVHDTMKVQGVIDGSAVYDKTVSPKGFLGTPKPFYGTRIAIARVRAERRVKSLLSS